MSKELASTPRNRLEERMIALKEKQKGQAPFTDMINNVFDQWGGEAAFLEWAEENPGAFLQMVAKANAAPPAHSAGAGGGKTVVQIGLHPSLATPGPLDVPVSEQ